ncbi:DUF421 domain-containing protein [Pseudoneobacillus sp. C159]
MGIAELSIRILLAFLVLFTLTRMMGRKEISQLTFFNFVSAIAIGTIGGAIVTDSALSIRNGVLGLIGWSILTIAMGLLDIKSKQARKVIEGEPVIVVKKGKIMEDQLRKQRLDMDELRAMLRKKEVFSLDEVEYAIFETDGTLSVMKKEEKQPVTKKDLNIPQKSGSIDPIVTQVVSDGIILNHHLANLNLGPKWLEQKLKEAGVESVADVFYAEIQPDGKLYIDKRNDLLH